MRRSTLQRLRAAVTAQQVWGIHPPTLAELWEGLSSTRARRGRKVLSRVYGGDDDTPDDVQLVGGTAVIPVVGVLSATENIFTRYYGGTATQTVERQLRRVAGDEKVKNIVLWFDSPGGTALGNQELYNAIKAVRTKKPVAAFVRGQCCSAAYYLASACSPIQASPSSMIGSVGCIAVFAEFADALKDFGINVAVITHGARKGDGNPYEHLKPDARASLQKMVTDYGTQFDQAVAAGRGVSLDEVRSRYGQGAVFLAEESRERGMVDAVGDWDALLARFSGSNAQGPAPETRATPEPTSESAPAASAEAALTRSPRDNSMHKRVIAALFARGLIASLDASEAECLAAYNAYFAALGRKAPESVDEQVAALTSSPAAAASAANSPVSNPAPAGQTTQTAAPAANVQATHENEMAEARRAGAQAERERVAQIRERGRLLNMSDEQINAAIAGSQTCDQVVSAWLDARAKEEPPVNRSTVNVGQEGAARYAIDAAAAVRLRIGGQIAERVSEKERTGDVVRLSRAPLLVHAMQCLTACGQRVDQYAPAEEIMGQAFAMDGVSPETIRSEGGAVNRPGSFPNLLSNLANKMLDDGIALAETTYQEWTGLWAGDLPDFKPAAVINKSALDELDEILDDEASKEFGLQEELSSFMQLGRYSQVFRLSPLMAANDDLNAFSDGLLGLASAHENTINRLCLRILTGNVTLLDGFELFDETNHGNDITAGNGAAPSDAQWEAMELKTMSQRGIDGKGYVDAPLSIALVPPKWKRAARQTFRVGLPEVKQAATDATINVYRGDVRDIVEPQLQASSTTTWYGLTNPAFRATVVRAYFRGWGRKGRRQRWYKPETKSIYFELEGRFGAAAKNYRYAVRNAGA